MAPEPKTKESARAELLKDWYTEDLIHKADLILSLHNPSVLPSDHEPCGVIAWFAGRPDLEKKMNEVRLPYEGINTAADLADTANDILQREPGYSVDTLNDVKKQYRSARAAYEKTCSALLQSETKLHRLNASMRNISQQNTWLVQENNNRNQKQESLGRELEDTQKKLEAIQPRMTELNEQTGRLSTDLIPLQEKSASLREQALNAFMHADELRKSCTPAMRLLHPNRYKETKQEIDRLARTAEQLRNEADENDQKRTEAKKNYDSLQKELSELKAQQLTLEESSRIAKNQAERNSLDLNSGRGMVRRGKERMHELEERRQVLMTQAENAHAEKEAQRAALAEAAQVLLHTWIGYSDSYRRQLEKLRDACASKDEIPAELIEALCFAPYVFTASGSGALAYLNQRHDIRLGALLSSFHDTQDKKACFRRIH